MVQHEMAPGTGIDEVERQRLLNKKGSGKGGALIAKDAARALRTVPAYITQHTALFAGIIQAALGLGRDVWTRIWEVALAVMRPNVEEGAQTRFYNEGETLYRNIVLSQDGGHFRQRTHSALEFLDRAGEWSLEVLTILQYMIKAKEAREAEHMAKRRAKLRYVRG